MAFSGNAVFGGTTDPVTGSWNNATALNAAINSADITGYGVVAASFVITGTITQGTAIFEVSDDAGTTWWPISGLQTGNNNQASTFALTGSSASFEFATGAYNLFRVRLNPVILGSGSVAIRLSAEAFPFLTAVAITGTTNVSITGTNNVVVSAALPTGANTIGAVTQAGAPWSQNITQVGGAAVTLGQKTMANSFPIAIASDQTAIPVSQSGTWNIGTVTTVTAVTSITNPVTVAQPTAANLNATVVGTGTFAVQATQSGTWTVQQGTPPWTIQGDSASGAAKAGNPVQTGGVFNTAQPTVTTGQTVEAQMTARGAQIVATGADAFAVNATQAGSWTVAATQSGTWTVQPGNTANTTPWLVTVATALPTGANTIGAVTQASGPWTQNLTQVGGAAVTLGAKTSANSFPVVLASDQAAIPVSQSGTWNIGTVTTITTVSTVTAVTSITNNVNVVGTKTNNNGAPGANNVGVLPMLANAAIQTWTEGDMVVGSVDLSGRQRVRGTLTNNNAAPTADYIGTMPAVATTAAPSYSTGNQVALSTDLSGNLRVVGSFSSGALPDLVGTLVALNALNTAATINAFGYNSVGMFLAAGTLVGTIVPEMSFDGGTTWVATFFDDPTTGNLSPSIVFGASNTATSRTIAGSGGASNYRVRVSAFTSGTANCTLRANEVNDPSLLSGGAAGAALPPVVNQVGGSVTTAPPAYVNATVNALSIDTAGNLRVSLLTALPTGANTIGAVTQASGPWTMNVTQFGGSAVVTGVGASGAGIPRVTVSNDSSIKITDGTTVVSVIAGTTALKTDLSSVAGTATVTAAAGVQVVGVADSAGNKITSNQTTQSRSLDVNVVSALGATMSVTNPVFAKITDGTTGITVKPASTAAVAADTSLVVSISPNSPATTVANAGTSNTAAAAWTSATANNTAVTLLTASLLYSTLVVTLNQAPSGTLTAGGVFFEVSNDNANWVGISGAMQGGGNAVSTFAFTVATYSAFVFDIAGWQYFRVRLNPVITGTGTVTVGYAAQSQSIPFNFVKDVKDTGRTTVVLYVDNVTAPASEALQTMNINKGGATSTATSYTVTAGKTLRIQSMTLAAQVSTGIGAVKGRLRAAASVLVTSPVYCTLFTSPDATTGTAVVGNAAQIFPDGLEIAGGQQVGISTISQSNTGNATVCIVGYEY